MFRALSRTLLTPRASLILRSELKPSGASITSAGSSSHDVVITDENMDNVGLVDMISQESLESLTGIPQEQLERTAIIFRPTRCTTQSGWRRARGWRLEFPKGNRWNDRLMGWGASDDPPQMVSLKFDSALAAEKYCKDAGWRFRVIEPHDERQILKSYGDRFKFKPLPKEDPIV
eukprot:TRINITY_DN1853_c0_g1_i2.p1 TRINITY_DN1853_c0_g1~~TRINITY_DN1853_c0_g1_i2.p1  ORF type:complete len:175 (-),score=21.43 TRINITY_DN1853_c0_g1_i2:30-554(-)